MGQGVLRAQGSKQNSVRLQQYSAIWENRVRELKATPWPPISCGLRQGRIFKWEKVFLGKHGKHKCLKETEILSKMVNYLLEKYLKFISPQNFVVSLSFLFGV